MHWTTRWSWKVKLKGQMEQWSLHNLCYYRAFQMNLHHQVTNTDIPAISGQVQDVLKEGKEVNTRL